MKTDGNGRENPSTVSVFYYGKRERVRNSWVRERKRNITVTETDGNRKIYRNALLFNHLSFCMNITLDTPIHKLFFKNMINISCFLRLKREIYLLMLRNMRGYMVHLFIFFPNFRDTGKIRDYPGKKRDPTNTGRIHLLSLPISFLYFSINTETGGINIKIKMERDGIFSVLFILSHSQPPTGTR